MRERDNECELTLKLRALGGGGGLGGWGEVMGGVLCLMQ